MKIYVTGMGIVSALGIGVDATLTALRESRSGIGTVKYLDTVHRDLPAGEVLVTSVGLIDGRLPSDAAAWLSIS